MEGSNGDIRPIPRNPLRFELLPLFAAHVEARGGTLQDVDAQGEFLTSLGQPLTRAVRTPRSRVDSGPKRCSQRLWSASDGSR